MGADPAVAMRRYVLPCSLTATWEGVHRARPLPDRQGSLQERWIGLGRHSTVLEEHGYIRARQHSVTTRTRSQAQSDIRRQSALATRPHYLPDGTLSAKDRPDTAGSAEDLMLAQNAHNPQNAWLGSRADCEDCEDSEDREQEIMEWTAAL